MYFSCKSTILLAIYTPVKCCNTCGLYCRSLLNFPVGWVEAEQCIAFYCYWVMASSAKKKIQDSELEKLKPFKRWVSMNNIFFFTQQKILTDVNFPMICTHPGNCFPWHLKCLDLKHASFQWVYQSVFYELLFIRIAFLASMVMRWYCLVLVGIFIKRLWKNVDIFADLR